MTKTTIASILTLALCLGVGCVTENEAGVCDRDPDIMWTYTKQEGAFFGTNRWCLHCNQTLGEEDLPEYVTSFYPQAAGQPVSVLTPCFYTYPTEEFDGEMAGCRQNVCSDEPNINDPVLRSQDAWKHSREFLGWD